MTIKLILVILILLQLKNHQIKLRAKSIMVNYRQYQYQNNNTCFFRAIQDAKRILDAEMQASQMPERASLIKRLSLVNYI